jgi:hypothetical protein
MCFVPRAQDFPHELQVDFFSLLFLWNWRERKISFKFSMSISYHLKAAIEFIFMESQSYVFAWFHLRSEGPLIKVARIGTWSGQCTEHKSKGDESELAHWWRVPAIEQWQNAVRSSTFVTVWMISIEQWQWRDEWHYIFYIKNSLRDLFSFHQKLFTSSYRMFRHMHKTLNINKKIIT